MQRRTEPLTPLGAWLMAILLSVAMLALLRHAAGGWGGLRHHRLRTPLVITVLLAALATASRWMVAHLVAGERAAAIGNTVMICSIVACLAAAMVTWSRFTWRWREAARITGELTALLDADHHTFKAVQASAGRPLALLEELTELIGPGAWAPGHEWATHAWIAERPPAAMALDNSPKRGTTRSPSAT